MADGAPGFGALANDIAEEFGLPGVGPTSVEMDDWNGDWDTTYPFSAVRVVFTMSGSLTCGSETLYHSS